ncbi:MAG TPA: RNA polymerase factor sigma-54 [Acidiferrobacteraceae bacterium]|nr:RNA polymerase factor sigma-54 [Acidiferrobacteraceae bacterium]
MRQSLELKLGQRLTMTPQLQQAIRLLQLSAVELQSEIQEALEANPLLEENEEVAKTSETDSPGNGEDVSSNNGDTADLNLDQATPNNETAEDSGDDWDPPGYEYPVAPGGSRGTQGNNNFEIDARTSSPLTLHDHLSWQMRMISFSSNDLSIAQTLIDSISHDGYLSCTIEEICQTLLPDIEVEPEEVEAVLHQIQNFDPVGVGARDVGECLGLQLRQFASDTPGLDPARIIAEQHLKLLASRDFTQLRRVMKLSQTGLQRAIQLIQSLNPRPGSTIQPSQAAYVIPDVIVRKRKGQWLVEVSDDVYPRIRVNRVYENMIQRGNDSQDNKYLQEHLQDARWFLKSLRNRHDTLLKVARAIVDRQRDYFEHGEEAMKPLVLHDIAETLGMHESTISRVTTQKYMLTPRGILELKYFFSSHVSTTDGGTRSATAIRSMIKKLIDSEPTIKPISDSKIVVLLEEAGVQVARRTIAKYREHMKIPPSNQRKTLV